MSDRAEPMPAPGALLILAIGNILMSDDGIGPKVLAALDSVPELAAAERVDGGTVGLKLLPRLQACRRLILIDAADLHAPPGTIRLFVGEALERYARNATRTPHDVGLHDLLDALWLTGAVPAQRALVAIQPGHIGIGSDLTPALAAAVEPAVREIRALVARWNPQWNQN